MYETCWIIIKLEWIKCNSVASYSALESGEENNSTYERTENLTYDDLTYTVNNQAISNFTYTFVTNGTYSLVASYSPYTNDNTTESQTLSISVEDVTLQSITKSYSGSNSLLKIKLSQQMEN